MTTADAKRLRGADERMAAGLVGRALRHPSFPAFVGMVAIWLAIVALSSGRGWWDTFTAAVIVGTILLIAGLGQMFVITGGNGGIDLSVSYVMTLCAFFSCDVMGGSDAQLWPGILAGLAIGVAAGLINACLIELVRMPPLVATLAVGFTLQTITLIYSGSVVGVSSPALRTFTTAQWGPVPVIGIFGVAVAVLAYVVLKRTSYGRRIEAVGQNAIAAGLAGARPSLIRASTYVVSAGLAGLAGVLAAAYAGGAARNLGDNYQLASIAVVVLGGSLIAGGRGLVSGVWAGAILLTLLSTLGNVTRLAAGWQFVIQGVLIVLVLALTRAPGARR